MTFGVKKDIAWFKITMDELSRMHILESLEKLIDDELFMNFLEDTSSDDNMKVFI